MTSPAAATARALDRAPHISARGPVRGSRGRPTVLLLGAYRQALAVARSLNAAGLRVVLGCAIGRPSALAHSRAISDVWTHPAVDSPQAFSTALEALCRSPSAPDYLFPLGDDELAVVAALAPLGLPVTLVSAAPDVLERCQQKAQLLEVVQSLRVESKPSEVATTPDAVRAAAERIGFPIVIKAHASGALHGGASTEVIGGKAVFIESETEMNAWLEQRRLPAAGVLVQSRAMGARHNVYFGAWQGELRCLAQTVALRTDRLDGTGLAVEGVSIEPMPKLVDQTRALIRELGYTGVGCAQFLVDPRDGSSCFLEINARLGANCAVVLACGLDLPRLFVALMHGDVPAQPPAQTGLRFAWLGGDIDGLLSSRRQHSLTFMDSVRWIARAIRAQLRADHHVTFRWSDPMPSVALLAQRLIPKLRRVRSSAH